MEILESGQVNFSYLSLSLSLSTIADDDFCDISVESHAVTLKYLAETDLCSRWAKFHFVQREWQSFPADWRLSWTRVRETDRSVSKKVISGVCVGLSASIELSETSKAFLSGVSALCPGFQSWLRCEAISKTWEFKWFSSWAAERSQCSRLEKSGRDLAFLDLFTHKHDHVVMFFWPCTVVISWYL